MKHPKFIRNILSWTMFHTFSNGWMPGEQGATTVTFAVM
jgi:hypothetical protein